MGVFPKAAAIAFLFLFTLSYAENFVAINSNDGRDVLSGIFYANVKGLTAYFMPTGGDSAQFAAKIGTGRDILLIESSAAPVSGFVESDLRSAGNRLEVYTSDNATKTNLDLAVLVGLFAVRFERPWWVIGRWLNALPLLRSNRRMWRLFAKIPD